MRGSINDLKFISSKSQGKHTPPKVWVVGTHESQLQFQADIMEFYYFCGMSQSAIARIMGCNRKQVYMAIKKYYPKKGKHDIVMSIMSKV